MTEKDEKSCDFTVDAFHKNGLVFSSKGTKAAPYTGKGHVRACVVI